MRPEPATARHLHPLKPAMNDNPDKHSIRRILLPSGRSIEIVRFYAEERRTDGLHVCPRCTSDLVQPVEWREAPQGFWELTLHCPNCDWLDEGVYDQEQVDALEEKLDEGLTAMLSDLRRLTQSNMAEEIERFTAALQDDLVLPEDF
ncbi:MAG TPA: hypothetical protein VKV21_13560 [Solirubrobacteraceae bacterium]|nr:hypothetical protein [Solirubrobacteraceae bacterium]